MARRLKVAAGQVGAIHRSSSKQEVVARLISLLHEAADNKVKLVVFPECTLTTFFPRHLIESQEELDQYFEHGEITSSPEVGPLFEAARKFEIDIMLGYAERTPEGTAFNTCIYFSASEGRIVQKYRKVHLPGRVEPFDDPERANQLEKRYFTPGDLGFPAFRAPGLILNAMKKATIQEGEEIDGKGDPILGMMICNDRRWPEAWRMYSLRGVEIVMFGYNTGGKSEVL